MQPRTRYAKSPGGHVAYQVFGEGPRDIVFAADHPSNLEIMWEEPSLARFLTRLSSMGRVICFDMRGVGISDPVPLGALPTLEEWMDDIRTVVDTVGAGRVVLYGHGTGVKMGILFAATYPERTSELILQDGTARFLRAPDYPFGFPPELIPKNLEEMAARWGTGELAHGSAPSMAGKPAYLQWKARYERLSLSPGAVLAMYQCTVVEPDLRPVLPTVRTPTLVIQRNGLFIRPEHGRYLADHIPQARHVELPGADYEFYAGDTDAILAEVKEFLTGERALPDDDRVLATVLFTDVVGSTERASALGDRAWRDSAGARWTRPATDFSRPSTVPPGACAVPWPSGTPCGSSASKSASVSTRANASASVKRSGASPCTSARASRRPRRRERCWCRAR